MDAGSSGQAEMTEKFVLIPGYREHAIEFNPHHQNGDRRIRVFCENPGFTSDGYHTINEYYEHRCLLFCALLKTTSPEFPFKSRIHSDGGSFDGYFLAGCWLDGKQITYHLPDSMWNLCPAPELERAPEWDGHSPVDVCDRLREWLKR